MKKLTAVLCLFAFIFQLCPIPLIAQDDEEEVFELSPFEIDARRSHGYRASGTVAGSRIKTELKDVGAAISVIDPDFYQDLGASILDVDEASDSHYAYANGVIVRFAVGYYHDMEENRRRTLLETLAKIESAVSPDNSLYYTPGALRISKGDRKKLRGKPKSHVTSYAHFSLSFSLEDGQSPLKRVAAVRQLITDMELDSDHTKIYYGEALLLTETPFSTPAYNLPMAPMLRSAQATSDLGASIPYLVDGLGETLRETIPLCAVTLIKPADSIRVQFAIDTRADQENERIQILNSSINTLRQQTASSEGLTFTLGSILLRHGNADSSLAKPSSSFTSQAQFSISFDLAAGTDALSRIQVIRDLVRSTQLPPQIEVIHYGAASLVVDNPQIHKDELLVDIFAEIKSLQEKYGEAYEVIPDIKRKRVQHRRHSLTEIEFWIQYDYEVESLRERQLAETKMKLEHERALATAQSSCCCKGVKP